MPPFFTRFTKKREEHAEQTNDASRNLPGVTNALVKNRGMKSTDLVRKLTETDVTPDEETAILEITRERMAPPAKESEPV